MNSIKSNVSNELIIKKSKFITLLIKVTSKEEVKKQLEEIKKVYQNANHYCYAYILDQEKKCSDDLEPSGTAGLPILNSLESENLHFVLGVVIRYFGGIKLGANGLIRAYRNSIHEALNKATVITLTKGKCISFDLPYEQEKYITLETFHKTYQTIIHYKGNCSIKKLEQLKQNKNILNLEIKEDIYIEEELI